MNDRSNAFSTSTAWVILALVAILLLIGGRTPSGALCAGRRAGRAPGRSPHLHGVRTLYTADSDFRRFDWLEVVSPAVS